MFSKRTGLGNRLGSVSVGSVKVGSVKVGRVKVGRVSVRTPRKTRINLLRIGLAGETSRGENYGREFNVIWR